MYNLHKHIKNDTDSTDVVENDYTFLRGSWETTTYLWYVCWKVSGTSKICGVFYANYEVRKI
jgi:hypothetical protein